MKQLGFLDYDIRLQRIDNAGDPLVTLDEKIDWEIFRPTIEKARKKAKKSNAGPIGFDAILMFKILILQSLYNLSDRGWNTRFSTVTRFRGFLVCMPPARFPTVRPSGDSATISPMPELWKCCSPSQRLFAGKRFQSTKRTDS